MAIAMPKSANFYKLSSAIDGLENAHNYLQDVIEELLIPNETIVKCKPYMNQDKIMRGYVTNIQTWSHKFEFRPHNRKKAFWLPVSCITEIN